MKIVEGVVSTISGLSLATADVDDVKAFASEFNVRKRMVPRLLLFSSRARQATVIKLAGEATRESVHSALVDGLVENKSRDAEDRLEKLTLAIGSGKEEM